MFPDAFVTDLAELRLPARVALAGPDREALRGLLVESLGLLRRYDVPDPLTQLRSVIGTGQEALLGQQQESPTWGLCLSILDEMNHRMEEFRTTRNRKRLSFLRNQLKQWNLL